MLENENRGDDEYGKLKNWVNCAVNLPYDNKNFYFNSCLFNNDSYPPFILFFFSAPDILYFYLEIKDLFMMSIAILLSPNPSITVTLFSLFL